MILETLSIEKAIELASPLAKNLFEKHLVPVIEGKVKEHFKNKSLLKKFESSSLSYLAKVAGQCSIINTIAFPNSPKRLQDLYIPLTIVPEGEGKNILMTDKENIFQKADRVLINDTAGMGKSTLSKRVVMNVINEGIYIPVFIELRQLKAEPITSQVKSIFGLGVETPDEFIKDLPLLYVFDGLDEVPSDKKKDVVSYLKDFIYFAEGAKILITSRLETFLSEFYGFSRYSIRPLENKEAYALLEKYDPTKNISLRLIAGLRQRREDGLDEFLSTPLYVSLLFCSYRHKTVIPQRRDLFYGQVYEALFESHDLSKEIGFVRPKFSKLDSAEFHSVLRRLGYWCLKNNGKLEFQKDELEIIVSKLLTGMAGIKTDAPSFVKDIASTVPLFVKEGPTIRWSHKSLMEYFAARFVCNDVKKKQTETLIGMFESDNSLSYSNFFELCADIDYSGFRSSLVKAVLKSFVKHSETAYSDINNRRINRELIDRRVALTYGRKFAFKIFSRSSRPENFWDEDQRLTDALIPEDEHSQYSITETAWAVYSSHMLHVSECRDANFQVLAILQKKAPELFVSFDQPRKMAEVIHDLSSKVVLGKIYVIDDKSKSDVNKSTYFGFINDLLIAAHGLALNKTEVMKELVRIDSDESNGVDDLLGI